jgi:hypothetical protein
MDKGDRNMQQANYRQFGVSHSVKVYWFLFVFRLTPIVIAIFFLDPPPQQLQPGYTGQYGVITGRTSGVVGHCISCTSMRMWH